MKLVCIALMFTIVAAGRGMWISCNSNSMWPAFDCHSTLEARFLHPDERMALNVDDVVWYSPTVSQRWLMRALGSPLPSDAAYIVHRIVKVTQEGYVTRGDNNGDTDFSYWGIVVQPYQVSYKLVRVL